MVFLPVDNKVFKRRSGYFISGPVHYEQDRSALKKKEWERRTQEVPRDEDLFSSGFNLFGEPYKTNKGDALANRVQNTLGNYDEMKELLTNHSNQSHLSSAVSGSALLHGHQGAKKSRSSDWSRGGHASGGGQPGVQGGGQPCGRGKHGTSAHEQPQGRHEDPFSSQGDIVHKGDTSPAPSASSSHSRRHGQNSKAPPSTDHAYKDGGHAKSPTEQDQGLHASGSPVASTSLLPSGLSTPTFPQGLHCKPSAVQQKPTAYVRPMDGQDQVPNDSPELKPPVEIGDGYSSTTFSGLLETKSGGANSKNKLPKLTLPQTGEVGAFLGELTCLLVCDPEKLPVLFLNLWR
ncbi:hypothetical protein AGOR_G00215380 [Albula goreensis]|uniref:AF4/FMR2 family member 2 n=1 Tax=Albula goreensis TaxID=1534307 RepID=A0A8T3CMB2_9TELE|nr:hypothetical protein AGOR_G00215380 [Albula goreensis]